MTTEVEYKDGLGAITTKNYRMSRLTFAKHLAMAGQGYRFSPGLLSRTVGMFLHYGSYIQRASFARNHFSVPPGIFSDPTEKGQFSTVAAKAIADFLSKKIDRSILTLNYEAYMRQKGFPISGRRPDLIGFSQTAVFAIESKGRSSSNPGDMVAHKLQSQTGPPQIVVNHSIASVTYNMFRQVRCKYHDPVNSSISFDDQGLAALSRDYYRGFAEFLNSDYFNIETTTYFGEQFYEVELLTSKSWNILRNVFPVWNFILLDFLEFFRPKIIIPSNVVELSKTGFSNSVKPFVLEGELTTSYGEDIYIDSDRIGLRISGVDNAF